MKKFFTIIIKIILILLAVIFVAALIFGGVWWTGQPLWLGAFILAGLIGLLLAGFLIRKIFLRRREQKFVHQIIQQESTLSLGKGEKDAANEMQKKWKDAMGALKRSHLKKHGNPLYVLPWYMIIGQSGSGKTTAIKSAGLSSSFEEVKAISGISGTKNCDWWFFEQAILIDTAGRYAIPVDEERDREEWHKFLSQLTRYRQKEPLNGLIVTVPADSLYDRSHEELEEYGRGIRQRVDELMRVLGSKFPIYLMVTKCDLVQGMTQFCTHFKDETLGQAMGVTNRDLAETAMELIDRGFNDLGERLRTLLLLILHKNSRQEIHPELILFPEEFDRLKPGVKAFSTGLFMETPYQETPIFRGLVFTSGRQEGTPFSHFLKDMGLIHEKEVLPGTSKGLFLHDFFTKLLPSDRGLFTVTQKTLEWRRLTRNLGFTSWVAIIVSLCGLLSFSFFKNLV